MNKVDTMFEKLGYEIDIDCNKKCKEMGWLDGH